MLDRPDITFIIPCMGRSEHAQAIYESVRSQHAACLVVVDYSDPGRIADWIETQAHPNVRALRVPDKKYFNLSDARNLGAALCETPYIAFLDADMALEPEFTEAIRPLLRPENYIVFQKWGCGYSGFVACWNPCFVYAGGYPIEAEGYGYEDGFMREALEKIGCAPRYIPVSLAKHMDHSMLMRSSHYEDKNIGTTYNRNQQLCKARLGRMRQYPMWGNKT